MHICGNNKWINKYSKKLLNIFKQRIYLIIYIYIFFIDTSSKRIRREKIEGSTTSGEAGKEFRKEVKKDIE